MATFTTRLGLTKPAGSEARSVTPLNTNADLIDKFAGCILVNDGVTPPTGDLFDGAIVKEKTSGIIWEARKNGGGTFDKVYIRYPFFFKGASSAAQSISNAVGIAAVDIATFVSGKNSSVSQIASSKFVIPIKGIYVVTLKITFASNATGERYLQYMLNGAAVGGDEYATIRAASATQVTALDLSVPDLYSANDTISAGAQQTSGAALNIIKAFTKVSMIEPVQ